MSDYSKMFNPSRTPQNERMPGRTDQVQGRAGGYVWQVDPWRQLERLLVLGTSDSTYYASSRTLTRANGEVVLDLLRTGNGPAVVSRVYEVSYGGKAHRNDPALFVLALCIAYGDEATRRRAYEALPYVARTFHHLTTLLEFLKDFGKGWGRGLRRAVNRYYNERTMRDAMYQMLKYPQRNGWTQRDVLLQAHVIDERGRMPVAATARDTTAHNAARGQLSTERGNVYRIGIGKEAYPKTGPASEDYAAALEYAGAVRAVNEPGIDRRAMAEFITHYRMPREVIPQEKLADRYVWEALLQDMPMTALIRNLPKLSQMGLTAPMSDTLYTIAERLTDTERLRKARVHPIAALAALVNYSKGANRNMTWTPAREVVDALDDAFYRCYGNVEPAGKRTLIGLDVSGSMGWGNVSGVEGLTPRVASAALALVTVATEPRTHVIAFTSSGGRYGYGLGSRHRITDPDEGVTTLDISPRQRLGDVISQVSDLTFGATDCALPMIYANQHGIPVDTFQTYTDSETWAGAIHPSQALEKYRADQGIGSRAAVVGMVSNEFSLADQRDPKQMDVVGFSTDTPAALAAFSRGDV